LSSAAVSYALRGLHVPPETQARVREAAERLGYQADPIARALASGRTETVGLLCGSLTDPWHQSLAASLGRELLEAGRNAFTVDAGNDPAREAALARRLVDQRVDALIVLPVDPMAEHWAELDERTALISIGDALPAAASASAVLFDNVAGLTDGLRMLAQAGHAKVTVLTPAAPSTPDRSAEQIVQRVAPQFGLSAHLRTSPHDLDGAAAIARAELTGPGTVTAFLCLADSFAFGVYSAAAELGLSVPDDISVVGYDDLPVSRLLSPPLSTYRWPAGEVVATVVRWAVEDSEDGGSSRRTVLAPEPMPRGSVAGPRIG
jgi:LacI family transcriptional regulator